MTEQQQPKPDLAAMAARNVFFVAIALAVIAVVLLVALQIVFAFIASTVEAIERVSITSPHLIYLPMIILLAIAALKYYPRMGSSVAEKNDTGLMRDIAREEIARYGNNELLPRIEQMMQRLQPVPQVASSEPVQQYLPPAEMRPMAPSGPQIKTGAPTRPTARRVLSDYQYGADLELERDHLNQPIKFDYDLDTVAKIFAMFPNPPTQSACKSFISGNGTHTTYARMLKRIGFLRPQPGLNAWVDGLKQSELVNWWQEQSRRPYPYAVEEAPSLSDAEN